MKASESLFDLYNSLSNGEKSAFKQQIGDNSASALVVGCMDGQMDYDEAAIKLAWQAAGNKLPHFASAKNYLWNQLLGFLRDSSRNIWPLEVAQDHLFSALLLQQRGLHKEAEKLALKALKVAMNNEFHHLILQCAQFLRAGLNWRQGKDISSELEDLIGLTESTMESLQLCKQLEVLHAQLFTLTRQHFQLRGQAGLAEILEKPCLKAAEARRDFMPRYHYHRCMARIAQLQAEWEHTYKHQMAVFALFQQFPQMQACHKHNYITVTANLLAACHFNERFSEMPDILSFLNAIEPQTKLQAAEIHQNLHYYRLLHAINTNRWNLVPQIAQDIEEFLEKEGHLINKARWLAIRYNLAIAFFFSQDHQSSLKALNDILNDERSSNRLDIRQAARLMQALLHYDLGNLDLLEYLLRSTRRQLKAENALHAFEEELLLHLGKLARNPHEQNATLESLEMRLELLKSDAGQSQAPGITEVQCWIAAKLQNISLIAALENRNAN